MVAPMSLFAYLESGDPLNDNTIECVRYKDAVIVVDPRGGRFSDLQVAWDCAADQGHVSIILRPGNYKFPSPLECAVELQVLGDVPKQSRGNGVWLSSTLPVLRFLSGASVQVSNIHVTSLLWDCTHVESGASATFENSTFISARKTAIGCKGNATIMNCEISGVSTGLVISDGGAINARNLFVNGCTKAGAEVRGRGSALHLVDSTFQNCAEVGVFLHTVATTLIAIACTFHECGCGRLLHPGQAISIAGCETRASIERCIFTSNPEGILVINCAMAEVRECSIEDGDLGICFRKGGSGLIIDSTISRISRHAVYMFTAPGHVRLTGNTITGHVFLQDSTCHSLSVEDATSIARGRFTDDTRQRYETLVRAQWI